MMLLIAVTGCEPVNVGDKPGDNNNNKVGISGEWSLVEWNGEAPEFHVYAKFDNGTFELYQQVWTLDYELFKGEYTLTDDILTGVYEGGTAWSCGYRVEIVDGKLNMYSQEDVSVTSIYEECVIPEEIITEATTTRSENVVPFL